MTLDAEGDGGTPHVGDARRENGRMTFDKVVAASILVELVVLALIGIYRVATRGLDPFATGLARLQPWVPFAAVVYGLIVLAVLVRWTRDATHGRTTGWRAMGVALVVALALGGFAFWELYIQGGDPAPTSGFGS